MTKEIVTKHHHRERRSTHGLGAQAGLCRSWIWPGGGMVAGLSTIDGQCLAPARSRIIKWKPRTFDGSAARSNRRRAPFDAISMHGKPDYQQQAHIHRYCHKTGKLHAKANPRHQENLAPFLPLLRFLFCRATLPLSRQVSSLSVIRKEI